MELFASVLLAVQVVTSLSIIVLVLLQQGKGADMGSSFGGGSAGSLFGASGAANFLSRMTKWAAIVFFVSTIGLAWVAHHPTGSILDAGVMQGFDRSQPAAPAGAAVPGGEVPGAAGVSVPDSVPQSVAPGSVPNVPSITGGDNAQTPSAPVAVPENADTNAAAVPDAPSAEPVESAAEPTVDTAVENN